LSARGGGGGGAGGRAGAVIDLATKDSELGGGSYSLLRLDLPGLLCPFLTLLLLLWSDFGGVLLFGKDSEVCRGFGFGFFFFFGTSVCTTGDDDDDVVVAVVVVGFVFFTGLEAGGSTAGVGTAGATIRCCSGGFSAGVSTSGSISPKKLPARFAVSSLEGAHPMTKDYDHKGNGVRKTPTQLCNPTLET